MGVRRANLIAAAVFAGVAVAPLAAQSPPPINQNASSFEILPPRRLPLPSLPFGGESQEMPVGFFSPQANPQPAQGGPPPRPTPPQQPQGPAVTGTTVMPLFGKPQAQTQPGRPAFPALTAATPAPAWRWHGYGSAAMSADAQPMTPQVMPGIVPNPGLSAIEMSGPITLPMPTQMPMPMPAGPVLPTAPTMPTPMPAAGPLPSYSRPAPAIEAVPIQTPGGDATWKPAGERIGAAPTNPMTVGNVQQVAFVPASRPDAGSTRTAAFVPAATPAPPPAAAPSAQGSLLTLRTSIETICSGRGRDLDMYFRSPNHLLIRMTVRQPADAERLADVISKLPEIRPYHVVFEISVAP